MSTVSQIAVSASASMSIVFFVQEVLMGDLST